MRKLIYVLLWSLLPCAASFSQESYGERVRRFDYERNAPLDLRVAGMVERRGKVKVYDISYESLKGGRVPAYLVVPSGKGPFAGILFGHWAMKNSPMANRKQFLDEAVEYARARAVSLLIDAPMARPGFKESTEPFAQQDVDAYFQQVMDMRRGVDLLLARKDIDPARIAFVGHSYNANVGGVLAGVEKRIKTFVLMAGNLSDAEALRSDDPQMVKLRQMVGQEKIEKIIAETSWLDPANYLGHAAPSSVLLQYAYKDGHMTEATARGFLSLIDGPKALKLYDAGHALNSQARKDRYEWLRSQIGLGNLNPAVLDRIKELK